MFDKSYIKRSGQLWKFLLGFGILVFGGFLMFIGINLINKYNDLISISLIFGGMVFVLSGFFWQILTIKCQKCGVKLFWIAVSKQKSREYSNWFFSLEKCPSCGNDCEEK